MNSSFDQFNTDATVFLIEDDHELRNDIAQLMLADHFKVLAYSNPKEFLNVAHPSNPAVIVTDMRMPEMSGIELQAELHKQSRTTPIIFISGRSEDYQIIKALKGGAVDFLLKPFGWDKLKKAVIKAIEIDIQFNQLALHQKQLNQQLNLLTRREHHVFDLLLLGCKNQEIAEKLNLSAPTIKQHKSSIFQKLQVESVSELFNLINPKTSGDRERFKRIEQ
jgi:hypothetical protein